MSNKLSDLLDQLAEKFPDEPLVTEAQDEYANLYAEEDPMDDMGDVDAETDPLVDESGPSSFDDLMSEDSAADAPAEDEGGDLSAIFGKAKPKPAAKGKKPNPFDSI